ncbi:glycosyltransferase family 9 protein [Spirosoma taeanense]|uniref:Glycosyltransferase family 9 protein n=1 Tax=Spirosoma taeanense TaxID=2735870 RepID=A0A6M5YBT1_9BACT|nr:glycosyltransferase family 9 protein [Spirosoma taeanense]QJW91004.1 glycosyltransferase family 9 protein [Spirosoma taeanense]
MITATNPPRFLIIQTAFIGDVILATALLEQLHRLQPDAVLDVLVRKGNESLLANHPFIGEVLIWDKKGGKYRDLLRLIRLVRARRYDAVLNLQRFGATGLLTALSQAGVTVGFAKNPFSRFFTYKIEHRIEPGIHEVDRNAGFLRPFKFAPTVLERVRPKLYPSPADYDAIKAYQDRPYICLAPTSVWFTKQYPTDRWAELIARFPQDTTIYLLGAPSDAPACDAIIALSKRTGGIQNLAGKLSLLQSAALQQGARMNYVNDSAPLHLCSAMNAPTTAIFCSTVPEFGFGPLADVSRTVETLEPLDCKPCTLHGRSACPLGHFRCAWSISVAELAELE